MTAMVTAYEGIAAEIGRLLSTRSGPVVIALDGGSGAGKSTIALHIKNEFHAALIPLDDFFSADIPDSQWDQLSVEDRLKRVFDWGRVRDFALDPLLAGKTAMWHAFDFESGLRPDGTYGMKADPVKTKPAKVILIEGAYSSHPELADLVDFSILVEAPVAKRHARLDAREDKQFLAQWHKRWDSVEAHYFTQVRPPSSFDLVLREN